MLSFKLKLIVLSLAAGLLIGNGSLFAQAPSHSYINSMRSGNVTHYWVGMAVEAEFGSYDTQLGDGTSEDDAAFAEAYPKTAMWQGTGIKNELGIEFIKFLQFNVSHVSLNLRSKENSSERLFGSRFQAGSRLVFNAPLGNLELGGGFLSSRLDYIRNGETSDFYGSGLYYELGYNYFLSERVSFSLTARKQTENMVRNAGSSFIKGFKTDMSASGVGFNIWM